MRIPAHYPPTGQFEKTGCVFCLHLLIAAFSTDNNSYYKTMIRHCQKQGQSITGGTRHLDFRTSFQIASSEKENIKEMCTDTRRPAMRDAEAERLELRP